MPKHPVIATHNGYFHADDVFGVAVLLKLNPAAVLVRTRNPELISAADFAVDVGGQWNCRQGRFDHHQKGFEGKRDDGTVYASAGLVWAAHGREFVRQVMPSLHEDTVNKVFASIDKEFVEHIDRADTGAAQGAPDYFGLSALLSAFNPTRQELVANAATPEKEAEIRQAQFLKAVGFVTELLERLVAQSAAQAADASVVRTSERQEDGRVLVLPLAGLNWEKVVIDEMPEVLFVVYPDSTDKQFQLRTVPAEFGSFVARKDLPASWAGLRDSGLAQVTGVADAVFCHNGRFIGGAASQEGALRMARLALAT